MNTWKRFRLLHWCNNLNKIEMNILFFLLFKKVNMFKPEFIIHDKVNWYGLCKNRNPIAIHILEKNLDKVCWSYLSENPNAIHILEKNVDEIDWWSLSFNQNAIRILEKNLDKVSWSYLSDNPNAIHLLEKNLYKVYW